MEEKEDRRWCVYMHIFPNNKKYIGITCEKPQNRWGKDGNGYLTIRNGKYTQPAIANAINKYCPNSGDWDNIVKHKILFENLVKSEASEKEKYLIKKYDTTNSSYGYNIREGGVDGVNAGLCYPVIQLDLFGNYIARYKSCAEAGASLDIDERYIVDCKNHNRGCARGFMFVSEEEYDPNKDYKYKFRGIDVVQFTIEGEYLETFLNPIDASEKTGINAVSIRGCCSNKYGTAGGYRWLYLNEWDGEALPEIKYDYKNKKILNRAKPRVKPVNRYDKHGVYICTYDSIQEASFDVECSSTNISLCCKQKYKTIKGSYWRYSEEVLPNQNIEIVKKKSNKGRSVVQFSLNGDVVAVYLNAKTAEEITGIPASCISNCCIKKQISSGGYLWAIESEYENGYIPRYRSDYITPVVQLDLNGNFLHKYNSIKEASEKAGVNSSNITVCCQKSGTSAGGYQWVYLKNYNPNEEYPTIKPHEKRVVKLTKDMEYVDCFNSLTEAANSIGKNTPAIVRNCKEQWRTAYGFKWMYEEDYLKLNK